MSESAKLKYIDINIKGVEIDGSEFHIIKGKVELINKKQFIRAQGSGSSASSREINDLVLIIINDIISKAEDES